MRAKLLVAAGLPAEALNLLTGRGRDFGDALTGHGDVAMISFTGGASVGQAICRSAGVKRVAMELGGNGPVIVMDDADVEKAAAAPAKPRAPRSSKPVVAEDAGQAPAAPKTTRAPRSKKPAAESEAASAKSDAE